MTAIGQLGVVRSRLSIEADDILHVGGECRMLRPQRWISYVVCCMFVCLYVVCFMIVWCTL